MKNSKLLTSGIAVALAGALLFGGTFAWQSISQTALNEVSASVNPGGRLHDDFNDITGEADAGEEGTTGPVTMSYDKNVYVENFTEYANNGVQVYARVRLDEYMELGTGAGTGSEGSEAVSLVEGAKLNDKSTWTTHKLGDELDENNPFHQYWDWTLGGDAVKYMPTFNRNKDSLEADINGSFKKSFADYVDYSTTTEKIGIAIYDADTAPDGTENDELGVALKNADLTLNDVINSTSVDAAKGLLPGQEAIFTDNVKLAQETHNAKDTLSFAEGTEILSMEQWKALSDADKSGSFWVYDTDGWAYWAAPIDPETATAPLLNGISRTDKIINQDWYYAINVVAQFITYDDMGQDDNTGFYDIDEGNGPSADALTLLKAIGVDVPETDVSDLEGLTAALAQGGIVNVTDDITLTDQLTVNSSCVLNLDGHTIGGTDIQDWGEAKKWSLLSVQDGSTVVINGGKFEATVTDALSMKDSYCVDVRDGSKVVINNGEFIGNVSAVYVLKGEAAIYGGAFSIDKQNSSEPANAYILNCYDANYANGTAKITVYGGTFENFDPSNCAAEGEGTNFVAAGYESNGATVGENTVYTVSKTSAPAVSAGE